MRRIFVFLTIIFCIISGVYAQVNFPIQVTAVGVGKEGTYLIKVYDNFKKLSDPYEKILTKEAVYLVLYKGIPAENGSIAQPPLITAANSLTTLDQQSFFADNGAYAQFAYTAASVTTEIVKIKKGNIYNVGIVVAVKKDALRKWLEKQGIIKDLDYIFN